MAGAVCARCAVGFGGVIAGAEHGNARARVVAFVLRHANDWICTGARAGLARIRRCACIAIIAGLSIRSVRYAAHARSRIACAGEMALIDRRARDGVCPNTRTRLARVHLRTCAAVVACGAVRSVRIVALPRDGIARTRDVTLIQCCAGDRVRPKACAGLARVAGGADVGIAAYGTVDGIGIAALTVHRIADACDVTLIQCGANDCIRSDARARLAAVRFRAGVVIATSRAVGKGWIAALTRRWIAGAHRTAGALGHANDRVGANTVSCEARVRLRTTIAIGARVTVRSHGIAALARRWITRTR